LRAGLDPRSSAMVRSQVRIIRHSGQTDIRVTPGGLLINTIGMAAKVRRVLRDARDLRSSGGSHAPQRLEIESRS
jgi:hypothetical protein